MLIGRLAADLVPNATLRAGNTAATSAWAAFSTTLGLVTAAVCWAKADWPPISCHCRPAGPALTSTGSLPICRANFNRFTCAIANDPEGR